MTKETSNHLFLYVDFKLKGLPRHAGAVLLLNALRVVTLLSFQTSREITSDDKQI